VLPFEFLRLVCVGMGIEGVLVEVDATVRELAKGSLLLDFGGLDGILFVARYRQLLFLLEFFNSIPSIIRPGICAPGKGTGKGGVQLILTYSSAMIAVCDRVVFRCLSKGEGQVGDDEVQNCAWWSFAG